MISSQFEHECHLNYWFHTIQFCRMVEETASEASEVTFNAYEGFPLNETDILKKN